MSATASPSTSGGRVQTLAELALAAVTLATVVGFGRLFVDDSFLVPLVLAAVGSHLVAALTRRAGWPIGRSSLLSLLVFVLGVGVVGYLDTTTLGLPGPATLDAVRADADAAWALFRDVAAPAPVEPGFVLALAIGIWLAAFLADWAAFRLWSPVEAIVPAAALSVFSALLGDDGEALWVATLFLGAVLAFELLHHVARQVTTRHWVNAEAASGSRALLVGGAAMAGMALLAAVVVGPVLPGAGEDPVVPWKDLGDDTPARVTVSPIVGIRSQLLDQPDVEVFTVRTDQEAYWRLTALDQFDGQIWKSSGSFEDVSGDLPRTSPASSDETTISQSFTIEALSALWLPAAFEPVSVDAPGIGLVYEPESATLIVDNARTDSDGLTYTVESVDPTLDTASLTAAGPVPPDIAERFLALPPDYDPELVTLADQLTAGQPTDYDRARALQDWFRTQFIYDDQVQLRHDIDSIEQFLEVKRGYCEQFAGTFAAFARSLGIPARVAVGFTWGDQDAADPTLFHVSGRHAHAWPEVWLPQAGWVAFEPTPGRGNPLTEEVTGAGPAQAPLPDGTPSTTPPDDTTPDTSPTSQAPLDPDAFARGLETESATGATPEAPRGTPVWTRALVAVAVVALVLLAYAALVTALKQRRHVRRRRAAPAPAQRIRLAWDDATVHLAAAGLVPRASETHREYTQRVLTTAGTGDLPLDTLAGLAEAAAYADRPPAAGDVEAAESASSEVADWVRSSTSWWERALFLLDPRPLLPRARARVLPG